MIKYLKTDPWKIVEEGFNADHHRSSESIFSIGNGRFGQRANFEEKYSGKTLRGSYVAGVYYPDKTRVGWWKNGYPEYFAKVLNSVNWIGINIRIDGEELDLATLKTESFVRVLDMKSGQLQRSFIAHMTSGKKIKVDALRICSMADDETAVIQYSVTALNFSGTISFEPYLDGNVVNHDSNYDETFWEPHSEAVSGNTGCVQSTTKKTQFGVAAAMSCHLEHAQWKAERNTSFVSLTADLQIQEGATAALYKYVGIVSSLNYLSTELSSKAQEAANRASQKGFKSMISEHTQAWDKIWELGDIVIEGDDEAQQGIRFNIFHLNQTYTGADARLNIGPKGFTGEKYGGSTYWDTEAYCIPFYLSTKDASVARQLLKYRYNQLDRAIENAAKLGFKNGAALYPMVTMNGEECHNEWEITFEEIHRNGAIAYAIYNYVNYTGDHSYLGEFGIDVLVGIARFWAQRVNWSSAKNQYVMLGVTGPNEYENNVNNNWYTNYIASWCLRYTLQAWDEIKQNQPTAFASKWAQLGFSDQETRQFQHIVDHMYYPVLEGTSIRLQQDGFMDKEQLSVADLDPKERPINQHWSWDRILRSIFIKQADVLQGMYFFENEFSLEEIKANFDFYEPKTVHESSLSPCVHSILAAKLGYEEKAYEMYIRTSRLDLDDYNHEAHEGLHITSMAGTWMSIVQGFGGMRVSNGQLSFQSMLPKQWRKFAFKVYFNDKVHTVTVEASGAKVSV